MTKPKFRAWMEYGVGELKNVSRKDKDGNLIKSEMEYGISINEKGEYLDISSAGDVWGAYNVPIMQDTGLCDKNGKSIWQGDIVKYERYFGEQIIEVSADDRGGFEPFSNYKDVYDEEITKLEPEWVEVIGNVFENKELLEPKVD